MCGWRPGCGKGRLSGRCEHLFGFPTRKGLKIEGKTTLPCKGKRKGESKMKKIIALVLALIMVFALAACGQSAAPATAAPRLREAVRAGHPGPLAHIP